MMNGRWKEGRMMIELFKQTKTSMEFDRMIILAHECSHAYGWILF